MNNVPHAEDKHHFMIKVSFNGSGYDAFRTVLHFICQTATTSQAKSSSYQVIACMLLVLKRSTNLPQDYVSGFGASLHRFSSLRGVFLGMDDPEAIELFSKTHLLQFGSSKRRLDNCRLALFSGADKHCEWHGINPRCFERTGVLIWVISVRVYLTVIVLIL